MKKPLAMKRFQRYINGSKGKKPLPVGSMGPMEFNILVLRRMLMGEMQKDIAANIGVTATMITERQKKFWKQLSCTDGHDFTRANRKLLKDKILAELAELEAFMRFEKAEKNKVTDPALGRQSYAAATAHEQARQDADEFDTVDDSNVVPFQAQIEELQAELDKERQANVSLTNEAERAAERLAQAENSVSAIKRDNRSLSSSLHEVREQLRIKSYQHGNLVTDLQDKATELDKVCQALDTKQHEVGVLRDALARSENEIHTLKEQLRAAINKPRGFFQSVVSKLKTG